MNGQLSCEAYLVFIEGFVVIVAATAAAAAIAATRPLVGADTISGRQQYLELSNHNFFNRYRWWLLDEQHGMYMCCYPSNAFLNAPK